jgi:hypothetical protein
MTRPRFDGGLNPDHNLGQRIAFTFRNWVQRVEADPNDCELDASDLNELRNLAEDIHRGKYQTVEYWDREQTDFLELIAEPNWILTEVIDLLDIAPDTMRQYKLEGRYRMVLHPAGRWVMPHSEVQRLAKEYNPNYSRRKPEKHVQRGFTIGKEQNRKAMAGSRSASQRQQQPNQVNIEQAPCAHP